MINYKKNLYDQGSCIQMYITRVIVHDGTATVYTYDANGNLLNLCFILKYINLYIFMIYFKIKFI